MTQEIDLTLSPEQQHYLDGITLWEKLSATNPRALGETEEEAWARDPEGMLDYTHRVQKAREKHTLKDSRYV